MKLESAQTSGKESIRERLLHSLQHREQRHKALCLIEQQFLPGGVQNN